MSKRKVTSNGSLSEQTKADMRSSSSALGVPPPPEKPTPNECCGSGCVPCIYDYYYDALEKWQLEYGPKS